MQIACNAKNSQFFCVVLLLCSSPMATVVMYMCNVNNYTSATFGSNMNTVLDNLVNNTSSSSSKGFNTSVVGQNPDTAYGLLQCWGDATMQECFNCSKAANISVRQVCGNVLGGRTWLSKCYIRYENNDFFGELDTETPIVYNTGSKVTDSPDVYSAAVKALFTNLSDEALRSPLRYSSGSTITSTFFQIYGMVQYWSDLASVQDRQTCLTRAIRSLLDATGNGTLNGGTAATGSCFARYEMNQFFNSAPPPPPLQTISPSPNQQPSSSPPPPLPPKKSSNKIGLIVGIVGGLLAMLLSCVFAIPKIKSVLTEPALLNTENRDTEVESAIRQEYEMCSSRQENLDTEADSGNGMEHEIIFNLENIKAATRNFHDDNKLGEGGFGPVYKGTMPDGKQIAVKKLSLQSSQGIREFLNEVKLVAKIQHRNLVNLLGCCAEGSERLLVYEFLANRSLDKILFHPQRSRELDWQKRLNIILGVARGLLYLHEDSRLRIIHRDIKASNILLDEKMQPKISDFGLARLFAHDETHVNTRVAGTRGYMAPEYLMLGQLSTKADVYSFGIVTLEIICGRMNTDNRLFPEFQCLVEWVWRSYRVGNFVDVIDRVIMTSLPNEQISRSIHIGLLCTQADASLRPSMDSIYTMLLNRSMTDLPNLTKPAYLSVTQTHISSNTSTSTSSGILSSSTSFATPILDPSINVALITELGA